MHTFKIELRVDFDDAERVQTVQDAMKVAAKHVYTTALLIADNPKRRPEIAFYGGDFFSPEEEIMLADDMPGDED